MAHVQVQDEQAKHEHPPLFAVYLPVNEALGPAAEACPDLVSIQEAILEPVLSQWAELVGVSPLRVHI